MKKIDTDDSKQPAFIVREDAETQHKKYWPTFSAHKQDLAIQVKELARQAYFRSRTFMNARDKFIAVKVERPRLADALQQTTEIAILNGLVQANNIEMVETKNNLLFRIKR